MDSISDADELFLPRIFAALVLATMIAAAVSGVAAIRTIMQQPQSGMSVPVGSNVGHG
jgi:hypothetical protein